MYSCEYDIHKKEVVKLCNLNPTEVFNNESEWLSAGNNKYMDVDDEKVGEWTLCVPMYRVDETWNRIKNAVKWGHLWRSKVSTSDPGKRIREYIILIYTKDYTDLNDIIQVLNYIERLRILPVHEMFYKRGEQPWIYRSSTIRDLSPRKF